MHHSCVRVDGPAEEDFLQLDSYKNVAAWCNRLNERPAVKRGLRVNGFGDDAVKERHSPEDFN